MHANDIIPFVSSIQNVFSTMLQLPVTVHEPVRRDGPPASHEVCATVEVSGGLTGTIRLCLPATTASGIIEILCGRRLPLDSSDFADAIGELASVITGGAKSLLDDHSITLGCPTVSIGQAPPAVDDSPAGMLIPCSTDCGELTLCVALTTSSDESSTSQIKAAA